MARRCCSITTPLLLPNHTAWMRSADGQRASWIQPNDSNSQIVRPLEDIVLDNVRVEVGKTGEVPGGFYDDRPLGSASSGGQFAGIHTNAIAGIHCEFVRGLTLRHTQVVWSGPLEDYYGAALEVRHVEDLQLEHFTGQAARPGISPDQIMQ